MAKRPALSNEPYNHANSNDGASSYQELLKSAQSCQFILDSLELVDYIVNYTLDTIPCGQEEGFDLEADVLKSRSPLVRELEHLVETTAFNHFFDSHRNDDFDPLGRSRGSRKHPVCQGSVCFF